ncbi:class I SAM-dependent methyltransferase [Paenibacillus hodogayensis]|uniref:Class I SAM-dependent methyltransferase n=1 Tax=Paenibacillus hodogayensis TaxID=279208 RepID=A0ABV5W0Z5_9BACL
MDIVKHNREAWNAQVDKGNSWTQPVSPEEVARARQGMYQIVLTPTKPIPTDWLGEVAGKEVLCLASGGGQQGPILAALGADVTVFDNSPRQLEQDLLVAERDKLTLILEQGDMRDLSRFKDESFDLIVHPVSNCFIPEIGSVWTECYRILRQGGALLAGVCNPLLFLFDVQEWDNGKLEVKYSIPYSDPEQLPQEQLAAKLAAGEPMEFGHSLESQIGGQIAAGFVIAGFYEDKAGGDLLDPYISTYMATRAVKLR